MSSERPERAEPPIETSADDALGASPTPMGRIVLAGTPIGNDADATPRLRELLATADLIAAEDTRRLFALLRRLAITSHGRVVSFFEHNEDGRREALLDEVRQGAVVLVVSDAGMPTVSDPGFRLVRAAVAAGLPVTAAPGPSAVLTALAVSGLPTDRFCFEGFLPRKPHQRRDSLSRLASEVRTMVFFESPHRVAAALDDMVAVFGANRPAVLCRELTKVHEEIVRGTLAELAAWTAKAPVRGELTLVVHGTHDREGDLDSAVPEVLARVDAGERLKDVTAEVAAVRRLSRRELYAAAVAARRSPAS